MTPHACCPTILGGRCKYPSMWSPVSWAYVYPVTCCTLLPSTVDTTGFSMPSSRFPEEKEPSSLMPQATEHKWCSTNVRSASSQHLLFRFPSPHTYALVCMYPCTRVNVCRTPEFFTDWWGSGLSPSGPTALQLYKLEAQGKHAYMQFTGDFLLRLQSLSEGRRIVIIEYSPGCCVLSFMLSDVVLAFMQ